jgi:hypothetical protein
MSELGEVQRDLEAFTHKKVRDGSSAFERPLQGHSQ